ncbi:MAG: glycosyltransferase family 4 protein [Chloroflexota bacterium]
MTSEDGPVRVLIIHPRDPAAPTIGGIQTFLRDFIRYAPADFEITFAGTTRDREARPIGRRVTVSIDGRQLSMLALAPAGGLPRDPVGLIAVGLAQVRLRVAMLRGRTVLQIHRPFRPVYLTGHRGPRVQFVHVDIRDWPGPAAWGQMRGLYREFSDRALRAMARVFVVNEPGVNILRADHPSMAERIEFLPVWYDPATFRPAAAGEREQARATLGIELGLDAAAANDRLVLFAGRLDAIKNPDLAIDALAEMAHDGATGVRLLIAGDGRLRAELEARARTRAVGDRVHFLGDVPRGRLAAMMRAVDVLLLTSRSEGGGPRVVLEALASGLPVVATPVGEVRRTVAHMVGGWLIEEHSPLATAAGLRWVLDQPTGQLSSAAIEAARPYTAERVLVRVYDTYRDLLREAR